MWQLAGAPPTPSPGVAGSLRLQASVTPALSSVEQRAGREKEREESSPIRSKRWLGGMVVHALWWLVG